MSERSIAEIMEWVGPHENYARQRFCDWCDSLLPLPYPCVDNPTPPTVDDMLVWLDAHTRQDQQVSMYMRNRGPAEWCVLITNPQSIFAEYKAPTLHAALEAAVRAVAEPTP